eukprot:scpid32609/ scgid35424/ 
MMCGLSLATAACTDSTVRSSGPSAVHTTASTSSESSTPLHQAMAPVGPQLATVRARRFVPTTRKQQSPSKLHPQGELQTLQTTVQAAFELRSAQQHLFEPEKLKPLS